FVKSSLPAVSGWKGVGAININLKGAVTHPDLLIDAKIPQGEIGRWPFQNATIFVQRLRDQWVVMPSMIKIWQGSLTVKGSVSKDQADLQLTGNDLSLQEAAVSPSSASLRGSLNFSVVLRGPINDLHTAG